VVVTSPSIDEGSSPVRALVRVLPRELKLKDVVVAGTRPFETTATPETQGKFVQHWEGATGLRKLRILLSLYRNEPLPAIAENPQELLEMLKPPERRAILPHETWRNMPETARAATVVELDFAAALGRGEKEPERFVLVRRKAVER